jgi:hypothetical protein
MMQRQPIKNFRKVGLIALAIIFIAACNSLLILPQPVTDIVSEAGNYYCYLMINNTSDDPAQIALGSTSANIQFTGITSPAIGATIGAHQTIEAKFQLVNVDFTQPTTLNSIRILGRWPDHMLNNDHDQYDIPVQVSAPVNETYCYTEETAPGSNYYDSQIPAYVIPSVSEQGTSSVYWPGIDKIYNVNDFDIQIKTANSPGETGCLVDDATTGVWTTVAAHSFIDYGYIMSHYYVGAINYCFVNQNRPIAYIKSTQWTPLPDQVTHWIKLRVTTFQ